MLAPRVQAIADDQHDHANGNCAVLCGFALVMLEERYAMFDFQGELVGL